MIKKKINSQYQSFFFFRITKNRCISIFQVLLNSNKIEDILFKKQIFSCYDIFCKYLDILQGMLREYPK